MFFTSNFPGSAKVLGSGVRASAPLDWVLAWEQNETGITLNTEYGAYYAGLANYANSVNLYNWTITDDSLGNGIMRYRTTYEKWALIGDNSPSTDRHSIHSIQITGGELDNGFRYLVNTLGATADGSAASELFIDFKDALGNVQLRMRHVESRDGAGVSDNTKDSFIFYARDDLGNFTIVHFWNNWTNLQDYETEIQIDNAGTLSFIQDTVTLWSSGEGDYAHILTNGLDHIYRRISGENLSTSYWGRNANVGWNNERIYVWA